MENKFYPYGRDSIIPVQNILCRFVPVKCKISNRQDAIEYLAINPINRKTDCYKICIKIFNMVDLLSYRNNTELRVV